MSEARWELLAPLLPASPADGGPRVYPLRDMINAVRWLPGSGRPGVTYPATGPGHQARQVQVRQVRRPL
ncbi:transposase [Actinomyces procaprae]|uniref:transposase n=1 Tax=Actinomyces procaprae TaxID=2560010 RepID=UPI00109D9E1D